MRLVPIAPPVSGIQNHHHRWGIRFAGNHKQKLVKAAVARGAEAARVGTLHAHSMLTIWTLHDHRRPLGVRLRSLALGSVAADGDPRQADPCTQRAKKPAARRAAGGPVNAATSRLTPLLVGAAGEGASIYGINLPGRERLESELPAFHFRIASRTRFSRHAMTNACLDVEPVGRRSVVLA